MKIVSYNVNGIRAAFRKGLVDWLSEENPDVLCLQEIKANESQIDLDALKGLGYTAAIFSAEKPGYSGTAILSKTQPDNVIKGCGHELFDFEGRVLQADFGETTVISAYFPSGSSGDARQAIKIDFLTFFSKYAVKLKKKRPNLIIAGDYNICREAIDIHNPKTNKTTSGFLPEEREWFASFLQLGFVDPFRELYSDRRDAYSWWSYRANARNNNKGWRIDYTILSENLRSKLLEASIHPEAKHSDHCPISVELDID